MIQNLVRRFSADEGQSLGEYALILALIAVFCVVASAFFGAQVGQMLSTIGSEIARVI